MGNIKTCSRCGLVGDKETLFAKKSSLCKECYKIYQKEYRESNKEKLKQNRKIVILSKIDDDKTCSKCGFIGPGRLFCMGSDICKKCKRKHDIEMGRIIDKTKPFSGKIYIYYFDNLFYIGQTQLSLHKRFSDACCHTTDPMYEMIKSFGKENVVKEILQIDIKSKKELNEAEIFYIKKFKDLLGEECCLNISPGGYLFSKESRLKISEQCKGEDNPGAKLTKIQVDEIRDLSKKGVSKAKLAEQFNVSKTCIYKIINYIKWKD